MGGTQPARGMRDFLPQDVRRRHYVIGVIADVYQRYGFEPLETPAVENIETLTGKYGEEGDKLIFKILKRGEGAQTGEADLALRYDLTVPLARVVAEYRATLPKFFKRYQVQPVWRADRPQKGRFREFYQCDVDAIGSTSMLVEAELLNAAADVFTRLGFTTFTIRVNHRQALTGILDAAGIPAALHSAALVGLDKLDKIGRDGVAKELQERGVPAAAGDAVLALFAAVEQADNDTRLQHVRAHVGAHEAGSKGLADLETLLRWTSDTSAGAHVVFDPSLARGLSYYTGPVFEVVVPDLAGSLGGGGRYDDLIGMFLGQQVPATGISLGLERILVVMAERGMFPEGLTDSTADTMILAWPDSAAHALKLAATLRSEGVRVEMYPDLQDKIDKKIKYAASRGVRCVAIIGDAEVASDSVVMRNMTTREQSTVACEKASALIKSFRPA